jgi:hypothetical protein
MPLIASSICKTRQPPACLTNEKRGTGPTGKRKRGSVIESYTGFSFSALVEAAAEAFTVTSQVTMEASVVAFCSAKGF